MNTTQFLKVSMLAAGLATLWGCQPAEQQQISAKPGTPEAQETAKQEQQKEAHRQKTKPTVTIVPGKNW
jgi:hypothetical protein